MSISVDDNCIVTFKSLLDGSSVSITLYSKLTCLYGEYSGEGKSHFFSVIADGISGAESGEKTIEVTLSKQSWKFSVAYAATLETSLELSDARYVFLIDEASMLAESILAKVNKSKHVFICITRAMPLKSSYPLHGIYSLVRSAVGKDISFDIVQENSIPLLNVINEKFDYVVTESSENHSEYNLLEGYLSNLVSANGRDRIEKVLLKLSKNKPNCKILVIADLGNIGQAYAILVKRCSQNKNIQFYNYLCFEQLLYLSSLVQEIITRTYKLNRFDTISLERYFSEKLERETYKTKLQYKHGKPLLKEYTDKNNYKKLFSSNVSKLLKDYIDLFGNM